MTRPRVYTSVLERDPYLADGDAKLLARRNLCRCAGSLVEVVDDDRICVRCGRTVERRV